MKTLITTLLLSAGLAAGAWAQDAPRDVTPDNQGTTMDQGATREGTLQERTMQPDRAPTGTVTQPAATDTTTVPDRDEKKKKRWWQFWKRDKKIDADKRGYQTDRPEARPAPPTRERSNRQGSSQGAEGSERGDTMRDAPSELPASDSPASDPAEVPDTRTERERMESEDDSGYTTEGDGNADDDSDRATERDPADRSGSQTQDSNPY